MLVADVDREGEPFKALKNIMELKDEEAQAIILAVKYSGDVLLEDSIASGTAFMLARTPLKVENLIARVGA